jgi:hypothetical protein
MRLPVCGDLYFVEPNHLFICRDERHDGCPRPVRLLHAFNGAMSLE